MSTLRYPCFINVSSYPCFCGPVSLMSTLRYPSFCGPFSLMSAATPVPFSDLKPLTSKNVCEVWQREWDEAGLASNKFYEILPRLSGKLLSFCNTRKENAVLNRLHIGHSYLSHSFILRKEEAPVCDACNTVLTVKHIMIECADLLEVRKNISSRSLCIHSIGM